MLAIGAVTAMLSVLLNLVLGLSRVWLAMARRGDAPARHAMIVPAGSAADAAFAHAGVHPAATLLDAGGHPPQQRLEGVGQNRGAAKPTGFPLALPHLYASAEVHAGGDLGEGRTAHQARPHAAHIAFAGLGMALEQARRDDGAQDAVRAGQASGDRDRPDF